MFLPIRHFGAGLYHDEVQEVIQARQGETRRRPQERRRRDGLSMLRGRSEVFRRADVFRNLGHFDMICIIPYVNSVTNRLKFLVVDQELRSFIKEHVLDDSTGFPPEVGAGLWTVGDGHERSWLREPHRRGSAELLVGAGEEDTPSGVGMEPIRELMLVMEEIRKPSDTDEIVFGGTHTETIPPKGPEHEVVPLR